jgi:hypothetical protein
MTPRAVFATDRRILRSLGHHLGDRARRLRICEVARAQQGDEELLEAYWSVQPSIRLRSLRRQ